MILFFLGIFLLVVGYFFYGNFVERILSPDERKTPAHECFDGVDFLPMPHWKNMLIQLLNIAGVGPVIGVILGIKFGSIVFLIIPIGNILGGAVHDFVSGMIFLRSKGTNLPNVIRENLGNFYYKIFTIFMIFLLLLVVAVFVNIPARLSCELITMHSSITVDMFWCAVGIIFIYYILATLFPIDKVIGKIYPIFGFLLIVGSLSIFLMIVYELFKNPDLLGESIKFKENSLLFINENPIIPVLFVTIACGIISGFHATQSTIVARTMVSEREAKSTYYGMMVVEGIIGMIWAAGGIAIYNMYPEMFFSDPTTVLVKITNVFLGNYVSIITILAVIILAVTSGDTAMRSLRLSIAEIFGIKQKELKNRFMISIPIIATISILIWWSNIDKQSFSQLWNYFAWGNQVLASSTLFACSVWLFRRDKNGWITLLPAIFMCFIVISYILWICPERKGPIGFGLDLYVSYLIALASALIISFLVYKKGLKK